MRNKTKIYLVKISDIHKIKGLLFRPVAKF